MFHNPIKLIFYIGITTITFKWSHCNWDLSSESYEDMERTKLKHKFKSDQENKIYKRYQENDDCEDSGVKEPVQCSCDCTTCKGPEGCCQVLCPDCRNYQPNLVFIPYAYPVPIPASPMEQEPKLNEDPKEKNKDVPNTNTNKPKEQTDSIGKQTLSPFTVEDVITNTPSTPYNMVLRDIDDIVVFSVTKPAEVYRNRNGNKQKMQYIISAKKLPPPEDYEFYDYEGEDNMKSVKVRPLLPITSFD